MSSKSASSAAEEICQGGPSTPKGTELDTSSPPGVSAPSTIEEQLVVNSSTAGAPPASHATELPITSASRPIRFESFIRGRQFFTLHAEIDAILRPMGYPPNLLRIAEKYAVTTRDGLLEGMKEEAEKAVSKLHLKNLVDAGNMDGRRFKEREAVRRSPKKGINLNIDIPPRDLNLPAVGTAPLASVPDSAHSKEHTATTSVAEVEEKVPEGASSKEGDAGSAAMQEPASSRG